MPLRTPHCGIMETHGPSEALSCVFGQCFLSSSFQPEFRLARPRSQEFGFSFATQEAEGRRTAFRSP